MCCVTYTTNTTKIYWTLMLHYVHVKLKVIAGRIAKFALEVKRTCLMRKHFTSVDQGDLTV